MRGRRSLRRKLGAAAIAVALGLVGGDELRFHQQEQAITHKTKELVR